MKRFYLAAIAGALMLGTGAAAEAASMPVAPATTPHIVATPAPPAVQKADWYWRGHHRYWRAPPRHYRRGWHGRRGYYR